MNIATFNEWVQGDGSWLQEESVKLIIILISSIALYYLGAFLIEFALNKSAGVGKQRKWAKKDIEKRQKTVIALVINVWRVIVIASMSFAIFNIIFPHVNLAPIFASAGIVGIALGFGAQSLAKDFLSGIFIVSENQYRVGDVIEIDGFGGTVERIGARSTVIRDVEGAVHYFPNGMIQHVINRTMGYSMARFTLAVDSNADIEQVISLINETGKTLAEEEKWKLKIIEAPAFVMMGELSAHAINMIISGKTQPSDQWSVSAEMRRRILEEFEKHHIKLGAIPLSTLPTQKKK